MEFGLEADGRAGCVRGDDDDGGDGYWSSRQWCLRRGTVLWSTLKRQRSGYVSSFFHSFLLTSVDTIEPPYSRIPYSHVSRISCDSPFVTTLAKICMSAKTLTEILK